MHGARESGGEEVLTLAHHGGNLDAAKRLFPQAPAPWIDLSTGINPFAYPVGELAPDVWTRLPEPTAVEELERAAAVAYGARAGAHVVAAPGTQSLIQWLPRVLSGRRVGILGPTYSEYAQSWRLAGTSVDIVDRVDALSDFDVAVVCNPNNPDGRVVPPEQLLPLAARRRGHSGAGAAQGPILVVDEAFADFAPEVSLVPQLPLAGTIVLRSFGKTYGLAGLRLGFAISGPKTAAGLRGALGPWAVSGPAVAIGTRALGDADWLATMARDLRESAGRLDELLESTGSTIVGGTSLFRLGHHSDATAQFTALATAGILVRPFDDCGSWLRYGIPGDEAAWSRLESALSAPFSPRAGRRCPKGG